MDSVELLEAYKGRQDRFGHDFGQRWIASESVGRHQSQIKIHPFKYQVWRVMCIFIWPYDIVQSPDESARRNFGDLIIAVFALQGNLFVVGSSTFDHSPRVTVSKQLIFEAHGQSPYHSPRIEGLDNTRALKTLEPFNRSSSSYFPFPPRRTSPMRSAISFAKEVGKRKGERDVCTFSVAALSRGPRLLCLPATCRWHCHRIDWQESSMHQTIW